MDVAVEGLTAARPRTRRPLLVAAAALLLLAGVQLARVARGGWRYAGLTTHPPREPVPPPPAADSTLPGLREVAFSDGAAALRGWYVPSRNGAAVILGHGHGGNRAQMLAEARILAGGGYGVLLFDWPAHGASGGERVTWGDRERASFRAAVTFVLQQPDVRDGRVGAIGFSMGGLVVSTEAIDDPRVRATVIEGSAPSLQSMLRHDLGRWGAVGQYPALWRLRREGVAVDELRPADRLCAYAPRKMLLVAGTLDPSVTRAMMDEMVARSCGAASVWMVEGAHHGDYARVAPREYAERLRRFFDAELRAPR